MTRETGRTFEVIQEPSFDQQFENDIEDKFRAWQAAFTNPESPGKVTVYEVPLDTQGRAQHSAGGQIRLGAWPADAYTFDDLCTLVIRDYMDPKKELMGVRFIGTRMGEQGVRFNSVTILRRPRADNSLIPTTAPKTEFTDMLQAMQESNERTMRMLQSMMAPREEKGGSSGRMQQFMEFAAMQQAMMQPMVQMMTAIMGRAAPAGSTESPMGMMKGMLEGLTLLDGLRGERAGGGDSTGTIVRAVADVASPLLQMAASRMQQTPSTAARRPPVTLPQTAPGARPASPVMPARPVMPGVPASPVAPALAALPVAPGVDLSQPSQPQISPFASGPDLSAPSNPATFEPPLEKPVNVSEVKALVDDLIEAAKIGREPALVAEEFFESSMMSLDEDDYASLCREIENKDFLRTISMLNSTASQFAPFFTSLRTELLKLIEQEDHAADSED